MDSQLLVEAALRVLIAWTTGRHPDPADEEILHRNVTSTWPDMPLDQLACEIVHREAGRVLDNSRQDRLTIQKSMTSRRKSKIA